MTEITSTLIDNIFCNQLLSSDRMINGLLCTDISDHFPVFSIGNLPEFESELELDLYYRPVTIKGKEKFLELINSLDWQRVTSCRDAQQAYIQMHDMIVSS